MVCPLKNIYERRKGFASAAATGTKSGQKRSHRKTHGISFGDLDRIIATRWKNIDPRIKNMYEAQAKEESKKYRNAVSKFRFLPSDAMYMRTLRGGGVDPLFSQRL